jgi:hypothetical protein
MIMKKCLACGIAAILSANVAMADYNVPGALLPDATAIGNPNGGTFIEYDLNGAAIPAGTYTGFSVSLDFTGVPYGAAGGWQNEAFIQFGDSNFAGTVVNHTGGFVAAAGAGGTTAAATLTYDGFFATDYSGGDPLWFVGIQAYTGYVADWSNISVTLTEGAPPASPLLALSIGTLNGPVDSASGDTAGSSDDLDGGNGLPGGGSWNGGDDVYQLNWGGGAFNADLLFTNANGDIDLFLYDDDFATTELASSETTTDNENINGTLAAGTYFLVVDGWSGASNAYTLNVTPEPASLCLLAMGAAVVIRRRR